MVLAGMIQLNDAKVARYFGSHPERGRRMPHLGKVKVAVGVRWSLPKQDYVVDDNVLVTPCVALICAKRGHWHVKCEPQYRERVLKWLKEKCS